MQDALPSRDALLVLPEAFVRSVARLGRLDRAASVIAPFLGASGQDSRGNRDSGNRGFRNGSLHHGVNFSLNVLIVSYFRE